jgi:hypothetical protein
MLLGRGEALALPWDTSIVNLDEGWLRVRKTVSGHVFGGLHDEMTGERRFWAATCRTPQTYVVAYELACGCGSVAAACCPHVDCLDLQSDSSMILASSSAWGS